MRLLRRASRRDRRGGRDHRGILLVRLALRGVFDTVVVPDGSGARSAWRGGSCPPCFQCGSSLVERRSAFRSKKPREHMRAQAGKTSISEHSKSVHVPKTLAESGPIMEKRMLLPSSDLLRAGLGLKLNQIKLATRSYLRDRTSQATGTVTSYAIAAGLFAAAGVFLIASCRVGMTALFRWIEINYGVFYAFGVVGGLLLLIAIVCAGFAAAKLKRRPPHFPSLTSRLRVAMIGTVTDSDKIKAALAPSPSRTHPGRTSPMTRRGAPWNNSDVRAGLILAAILLGWAATRRRRQAKER